MKLATSLPPFLLVFGVLCLASCGDSDTDPSKKGGQPTSSSSTSQNSSQAPQLSVGTVKFIYPTQQSHLGGVEQVPLVVQIIPPSDQQSTVSQLKVGDVEFEKKGQYWYSTSELIITREGKQIFEVQAELAETGEWVNFPALSLNNSSFVQASSQQIYSIKGLAIDLDDSTIFFSNPYDAEVYELDFISSDAEIIYSAEPTSNLGAFIYWPIAIDSAADTLYLSEDKYSYNQQASEDEYTVSLVKITPTETQKYPDSEGLIKSTRGLLVDIDAVMPMSGYDINSPIPSIFSIDFLSQETIQRWFLDNENVFVESPNIQSANDESSLSPDLNILALAGYLDTDNSKVLVSREFANDAKQGESALIEVTSEASRGTPRVTATFKTLLEQIKPTALAYNREGTHVFIADANKIWKMNMTDYSKELVTSSSSILSRGEGNPIGSNVTAMVLHPELDYLYLAADTNGLIMVDLATGNRITVVK
ncbi:hypothetical protein [Marinagarivorans algicola]|uniref:hypothetical protein n=1 Tax=Marinagarivorans algicola TaxID=1513270 RepID=UPI0006B9B1E3|nr:hypothetical protein [Marinagarivorans algicola]